MQQQIDIAEKQRKVEIANGLPDIKLGYFNQTLIGTQTVDGQEMYFDASKRFQGFQVGLAIPLFFNAYNAKVKSAALAGKVAQGNAEATQANLQGAYLQAVQEYIGNRSNLTYYNQSALPSAQLILSTSKQAYALGEIGYPEYLLNLKTANEIMEKQLLAMLQTNLSVANIQFLIGQ
jgi:cobalt-zinc-cadmium resistance protein CzcA